MSLTFNKFQEINKKRNEEFCDFADGWVAENWSNALAGETGEFCNWVKKMDRLKKGYRSKPTDPATEEELKEKLGEELADIICYVSLSASYFGFNLEDILIKKFNEVSDRFQCSMKL